MKENNIIIEIPKLEDLNKINALAVQLHDLHVEWRPDIFIHTDTIFTENDLENIINNKSMFVVKKDNEIVGYVIIKIREMNSAGYRYRKELNIDAIVVEASLRGKGIGTLLLEYIKKYAKEIGCTDIRLTVNVENEKAIKVYEKLGMSVKNIAYSMRIQ